MNLPTLSYLPYHVALDLIKHPDESPVGREERFQAVVLFADVSGFTAISEALGNTGRQGTEELTSILNNYFEPISTLINTYGGIIGKFGGDSLTVLFALDQTEPGTTLLRTIRCALNMQQKMGDFADIATSSGNFSLAMKIGLAAGSVYCTVVGDPDRYEYIIAGEVLDNCAAAEALADKGQIVTHFSLPEKLADYFPAGDPVTTPLGGNFYLVESLKAEVTPALLPPLPEAPPEIIPQVDAFLHPVLTDRLRRGQGGFINEHRKVTILFVGFDNFDYDHDPQVGVSLQGYLLQAIETIRRYDGYLNKVDMGDKGSKYIALFGAPVSHEDDEERALRCSIDLLNDDFQFLSGIRIGINTGFVYCGQVGSDNRREYTVMGDAVNLAARLMQNCQPGQILVSKYTQRGVADKFEWEELAPLTIKGKAEPVEIFGVLNTNTFAQGLLETKVAEREYQLPMVGRKNELARFGQVIEQVKKGQGQVFGITAEAGMGKSRFAAEVINLSLQAGFSGYAGECLSYGTSTSYLVWQSLLRALFGLDPDWKTDRQQRHLTQQLQAVNPALVNRLPLLSTPLNVPVQDNELTRAMDAKLRKSSLESLLLEFIRWKARRIPLLLVFEDCHWIDPLSEELLEGIARNIADLPVLILLVHRTLDEDSRLAQFNHFPHFQEIKLAEFSLEETEQLVSLKLAQLWKGDYTLAESLQPPPGLVERVAEKSQGNPFYIDELLNLIQDRGVDPSDPAAIARLELPDSLSSLIVSRIDQLQEGEKLTVKIASAIGRLFKASWLWGLNPPSGSFEELIDQLEYLSRLELVPLDKPAPEFEYLFKHVLTREVAYETLALSTRRYLHEEIGNFIERTYPENLDQFVDLLAHHFGQSQNIAKQKIYFRKAAEAARAVYAIKAALGYYRQLDSILEDNERGEVALELGNLLVLVNEWDETATLYQKALEIAETTGNLRLEAQVALANGGFLVSRTRYAEAAPWLERARARFELLEDRTGVARCLAELGNAYRLQSNNVLARESFAASLAILRVLEPGQARDEALVTTLKYTGMVDLDEGQYTAALENFQKGLEITLAAGNKPASAGLLNNQAIAFWISGNKEEARLTFEQSLKIQKELGDRWSSGVLLNNLGLVAHSLQNYELAEQYLLESLSLQRQLGEKFSVANALSSLGNIMIDRGDFAAARRYLLESLQINRELGLKRYLAYVLEYLAGLAALEGKADKALKLAGATSSLRDSINSPLFPEEKEALDQRLTLAWQALENDTGQRAFAHGKELPLEEALVYAEASD